MESFLHQGDLCLWQRGAGSAGERCRLAEWPWLVCLWLYPFLAESLLSKGCCRFRVLSFFRVYFSLFSFFPFLFSSFLLSFFIFFFLFLFSLFTFPFLTYLLSFFPFLFFFHFPSFLFFLFLSFFVLHEMKGIGVPGRVEASGQAGCWESRALLGVPGRARLGVECPGRCWVPQAVLGVPGGVGVPGQCSQGGV